MRGRVLAVDTVGQEIQDSRRQPPGAICRRCRRVISSETRSFITTLLAHGEFQQRAVKYCLRPVLKTANHESSGPRLCLELGSWSVAVRAMSSWVVVVTGCAFSGCTCAQAALRTCLRSSCSKVGPRCLRTQEHSEISGETAWETVSHRTSGFSTFNWDEIFKERRR